MCRVRRTLVGALLFLIAQSACSSDELEPCPSFDVADEAPRLLMMRTYVIDPTERAEALADIFTIRGQTVTLRVPIDWHQDPFDNRSWRMWLHALDALKPLLYHYQETGEVEALARARDIALDWIEQNPLGAQGLSEFAWYDMSVALRAVRLSYLHRALEYEKMTTPAQRELLGCAVTRHARWLMDNAHYKVSHNHGLYSDIGLFIAALQLDLHPEADAWRTRARSRFVANVTSTVSTVDGLHLEHSPVYHMLITEAVRLLNFELGLDDDGLTELLDKMTAAASWLVMPDGRVPQFGDTDLGPAVGWAVDNEAAHRGFGVFFDAGTAIYRDEKSYFMTVAWYHSLVHKHADELSFVWAEDGRRLLVDSGRYGFFYDDPGRIYAESSPAHNTLTLDSAFTFSGHEPYGSGVIDAAQSGGWYAVLAENPLLAAPHRRVFAVRPGRWLVVVDQIDAVLCPTTTRRFHFAPALEVVEIDEDAVRLTDAAGSLWLQTAGDPLLLRRVRGQMEPDVQGFTFPAERTWVENTTIELVDDVCGSPMVVVLSVGAVPPAVSVMAAPREVELLIDNERVSLRFADDTLSMSAEAL